MSPSTTASTARVTLVYRVFLACALAVSAVAAVFFLIGISDGSVSSFNIGIWIALLAGLSAMLAASLVLRRRGSTGGAIAVLSNPNSSFMPLQWPSDHRPPASNTRCSASPSRCALAT